MPGADLAPSYRMIVTAPSARSLGFRILRFASLLIGAGLLMRTASAENIVSAATEPARHPESRQAERRPTVRLVAAHPALPKPTFGIREPRKLVRAAPRSPETEGVIARQAAMPQPGSAPQAELAPTSEPIVPGAVNLAAGKLPASGLLAPVRIVVGTPKAAQTLPAPAGLGTAAPQPVSQPPQLSPAPPTMRPGPRNVALVSDVQAEMRRPASAWDYAELAPSETASRARAIQDQGPGQRQGIDAGAAAAPSGESAGTSLRDSLPHPAF